MIVGFKGLRESFSCRVHKQRPHEVIVSYIDGPMKHLSNEWHFHALEDGGCRVDFMVDFTFRTRMFEALAGPMFDHAVRKMIAPFDRSAERREGNNCASTCRYRCATDHKKKTYTRHETPRQ